MQYVTAVISGREGIFPLNLDLKTKSSISKILMQMAVDVPHLILDTF